MQTEKNHALEQAKAQAASIVEMVRALDRETAAEDFISIMSPDALATFLAEHDVVLKDGEDPKDAALELMTSRFPEDPDGFEFNEDEARERIQEDPLSVEVRSGWYESSSCPDSEADKSPAEFRILLCTGGPAVRIVGELDRGEPSRAWIEYQDWGTPWTQLFGEIEQDTLLTYCRQFYFGE